MIDHIVIKIANFEDAKSLYDAALAPLHYEFLYQVPLEFTEGHKVGGFGRDRPQFWISEEDQPSNPIHVAFMAETRAQVDAFYEAAIKAGGQDNGGPGLRPHYHKNYYAAFVFDLDGNNIEAVCHKPE